MTDIEIAQKVQLKHISEIAAKLNLKADDLELYGKYKAKIPLHFINPENIKKNKLILMSAITPTPPGEGKTTMSIGLTQGMNRIG
ncbi:MAG TPA: formate--tetrahydrofolate ligase, partial [Saprospiraceae bacterium]|nr:formate--tetrahydrofolate ligase [Saprospiraceae bacterium]